MNEGWNSDPEFEYEYPQYVNGTAVYQKINRTKTRTKNVSNFRNTLTMNIDSRKVGKLIGRGGCNIKELAEKSKARIKVSTIMTHCVVNTILTHCVRVYFVAYLRARQKKRRKKNSFSGKKQCNLLPGNNKHHK